jgi:hypothetical protein
MMEKLDKFTQNLHEAVNPLIFDNVKKLLQVADSIVNQGQFLVVPGRILLYHGPIFAIERSTQTDYIPRLTKATIFVFNDILSICVFVNDIQSDDNAKLSVVKTVVLCDVTEIVCPVNELRKLIRITTISNEIVEFCGENDSVTSRWLEILASWQTRPS